MTKPVGKWKLPQPTDLKENNEWVPIPRVARTIPFGYEIDPEDNRILLPIDYELDMLEKASRIKGVTKLVMNKVDILEEIKFWKLYEGINAMEFSEKEFMLGYIEKFFQNINPDLEVLFSGNKEAI